jgi:SPP1 gp7 family putative phage head morphogenesis protein|nr:MAG TPA: minor capsid protein [Caudoviricetes sp.]
MAKSKEYWKKRFEKLEDDAYRASKEYYNDLQEQFRLATSELEKEIASWYYRVAENNEISYSMAKRYLNRKELKEFRWTVEDYIKFGKENALDQKWMKELENASARVHITRLETIKIQLQQLIEKLFIEYEGGTSDLLNKTYKSSYYKSAYEIAKGTGVGKTLHTLDDNLINGFLRKPWAADGKDFSSRIWQNKEKLVRELHTELTQQLVRGSDPGMTISALAKKMDVSKSKAGNLIMTETAAIHSMAQKQCFSDLDVEKYEIIVTMDIKTSQICRDIDKKYHNVGIDLKDYQVNVTAPPFHCRCRTCTCPFFDDEFTKDTTRVARDPITGKTYHVPADMTYQEWYDKYVVSNPEALLAEKKVKNYVMDQKQYLEYKDSLDTNYVPKSIEEFQTLKYTNTTEYGILKAQYKGMSFYNKAIENEKEITKNVKKVASDVGMEVVGLEYRVKGKDSYLRKIRSKYGAGKMDYEVDDIIRYTYTAPADELAEKTLSSIAKHSKNGYNTIEIKNSWNNPNNPYRGINTTLKTESGQKFELQYHTPESFELKNGKMHELYEKQRLIEDTESEEYILLRNQMFDLSDKLERPTGIERVK